MAVTLALDIGGTKIAAGILDDEGTVLQRFQQPTPRDSADAAWQVTAELIRQGNVGDTGQAVGIASAGPVRSARAPSAR